MTSPSIHPCFLGPYGENDALLEKLVVEFLRDHVYWRRNFHPEDPPAIPTGAAGEPAYRDFEARMRRELHQLSAALKTLERKSGWVKVQRDGGLRGWISRKLLWGW